MTLLSNKMKVAEEITRQINRKAHIGVDSIRTQLRKEYDVIGETELAKRVYRDCLQCKHFVQSNKFEQKANEPQPSQIQQAMYKRLGLHLTGALPTKSGEKVYVLIIICLYSRHVTLKVVESLEANDVELALVRIQPGQEGMNGGNI